MIVICGYNNLQEMDRKIQPPVCTDAHAKLQKIRLHVSLQENLDVAFGTKLYRLAYVQSKSTCYVD